VNAVIGQKFRLASACRSAWSTALVHMIAALASAQALNGCTQPNTEPILYQATTPDCQFWVDGSKFELPQGISVFASPPRSIAAHTLELSLTYFIPKGEEATFTNQKFVIRVPRGSVVAHGAVALVDRRVSGLSDSKAQLLSELPLILHGLLGGDETMYRVDIDFVGKLPERFDFTPPVMIIDGDKYPLRTYTYRFFKQRQAYGLCT
jgi:hypothetical protein